MNTVIPTCHITSFIPSESKSRCYIAQILTISGLECILEDEHCHSHMPHYKLLSCQTFVSFIHIQIKERQSEAVMVDVGSKIVPF
ncbi:hypothetical protein HanIR_Chr16g0822971 [Helianthus annuus]|nr:hypothetical protein HanIR_Chr16g0822971 [Helianthus annuus]